jgi:hypothetical protein
MSIPAATNANKKRKVNTVPPTAELTPFGRYVLRPRLQISKRWANILHDYVIDHVQLMAIDTLNDEMMCAYYNVDPIVSLDDSQDAYPHVYYDFYSDDAFCDRILHISVKNARAKFGSKAESSIMSELEQLHGTHNFRPTWKGVLWKDLTIDQRSRIIRSFMFLKEKYLPNGEFDKLKSRLVGGGNDQDLNLYSESSTSSPTISTMSALVIATIAAKESRHVAIIDIPGAYLQTELPTDSPPIHMHLDPTMTSFLIKIDPSFQKYVRPNGSSIVQLTRALYGLVESAKLWYNNVSATLINNGFIPNPHDNCVFNKQYNGNQITIGIHVDDFIVTCVDIDGLEHVKHILTAKYGHPTPIQFKAGKILSYLGMTLDYTEPGVVRISQHGFVNDLLHSYSVTGAASTPALPNLFVIDTTSPPLDTPSRATYHSIVASVLYLAKRTRPDLLLAVSFLSTRVQKSTEQDRIKLDRLLRYINSTKQLILKLTTNNFTVVLYADASFGIHHDAKSHTGTIITLGNGALFGKSARQSIVTKSSTEAELVGLSDSLGQALWLRNFLIAQGYDVQLPVHACQDNLSTIALTAKGKSTSDRTRHIGIRFFWIKDLIDRKEVSLQHISTHDMMADILTKPLQGIQFVRLRDLILGYTKF